MRKYLVYVETDKSLAGECYLFVYTTSLTSLSFADIQRIVDIKKPNEVVINYNYEFIGGVK